MENPAALEKTAPAPEKEGGNLDYFLGSLVYLTRHYGRARSAESIRAGLAYDEKGMGPELFCQAAERTGFRTKISAFKALESLPDAVFPLVLPVDKTKAVVVLAVDADSKQVEIWNPDTQERQSVALPSLMSKSTGHVIYIHPRAEFIDPEAPHAQDTSRHWFWGPVLDEKWIYSRVLLAALLINIFALASPIFIMSIYDRVLPNNALETGWVLGVGALTVFIFDFIIRTIRGYLIDLSGRRVDVRTVRRVYDHVLDMKLAGRPASSGVFANILRDFDSVRDFMTSATVTALIDLPFTLVFLGVIWLLGGPIAFALLGLILAVVISGLFLQIPLRQLIRKSIHASEIKHGLLVETVHTLETVKAIGADSKLRAKYGQHTGDAAAYAQHSRFVSSLGVNLSVLLQQIVSIIVVLMGMYLVQDGDLTVGGLIACVILGGRAIAPIGQIANLLARYHYAAGALKGVNNIMAQPAERPVNASYVHRPDLKGGVSLQNVKFSYPGTDQAVLNDVSFTIKAGEKVAIIGRIGSGKSTIARLVLGLYEPAEGHLLMDGTDYRQIDPADLRRSIGYIAQDVVLFRGTVRDNIMMARPRASEEDMLEAAKEAGVHEFIGRHPQGYDAPVGEGGQGLSGGQRQAIALARAFLGDPALYVADEPTNAMDMQAEEAFTRNIKGRLKNSTLILITHRTHLLKLVDRLIVLDQGKVVLDGPRDKVLETLAKGIDVPQKAEGTA